METIEVNECAMEVNDYGSIRKKSDDDLTKFIVNIFMKFVCMEVE